MVNKKTTAVRIIPVRARRPGQGRVRRAPQHRTRHGDQPARLIRLRPPGRARIPRHREPDELTRRHRQAGQTIIGSPEAGPEPHCSRGSNHHAGAMTSCHRRKGDEMTGKDGEGSVMSLGWGSALLLWSCLAERPPISTEEVTILFPTMPDPGTDLDARGIAPFFEKEFRGTDHIGNAGSIGGKIGLTRLWRAKPDGTTLLIPKPSWSNS